MWGGTETLIAISELFNTNIKTIWEGGPLTETKPSKSQPTSSITIVYRKSANGWNHYDSFLCEERISTANAPSQSLPHAQVNEPMSLDSDSDDLPHTASSDLTPCLSGHHSSQKHSLHEPLSSINEILPFIKIGTWNVRGTNDMMKRHAIDDYLSMSCYSIIALQETKLAYRACDTKHYKWIPGKDIDKTTTHRGLAILVHLSIANRVLEVFKVTTNILACKLTIDGGHITLVNVHIPSGDGKDLEFVKLTSFIARMKGAPMILLEDFNAHIGKLDITDEDRQFIGPNLYHAESNENGEDLKNLIHLHRLSLKSSWGKSKSTLTTWTNGKTYSQIDNK